MQIRDSNLGDILMGRLVIVHEKESGDDYYALNTIILCNYYFLHSIDFL